MQIDSFTAEALAVRDFAGHWRDDAARRADAAVHLAGGTAALAAAAVVLGAAPEMAGPLSAYALALVALFPASGLFQHGRAEWREITIKLDHAAIYLKIAATCGALIAVSGDRHGPSADALWLLALAGAALRAAGPARMRAASLAVYGTVLGGSLFTIWPALLALSPEAHRLAVLGGGLYLAGLPFHLSDGLRFNQAIWHALVLLGSGAVWGAIVVDLG